MVAAWRAYNKARNLRADRLRLQIPKWFWVWCTLDAGGKIKCPPGIFLELSMLQYAFETLTWAPSSAREAVDAAGVVNPALRQPHVTAPWVQEFADARAQVAADTLAAVHSLSDISSAKTPIPAADQADVQAELGAIDTAKASLNVLADLASNRRLRFRFRSVILLILHLFSNHIPLVQRFNIVSSFFPRQFP
ncbi:unnamed protein product [Phytophthora fragariaefolia]|uniref:Unnamed protein product n=1 Tax=Phytophthora fragariaefolia TaxID=1490495 RepID=A0A9W6YRN0_9STRA|nr:unnamed protein product [Phytophthora fragariaefolia]